MSNRLPHATSDLSINNSDSNLNDNNNPSSEQVRTLHVLIVGHSHLCLLIPPRRSRTRSSSVSFLRENPVPRRKKKIYVSWHATQWPLLKSVSRLKASLRLMPSMEQSIPAASPASTCQFPRPSSKERGGEKARGLHRFALRPLPGRWKTVRVFSSPLSAFQGQPDYHLATLLSFII